MSVARDSVSTLTAQVGSLNTQLSAANDRVGSLQTDSAQLQMQLTTCQSISGCSNVYTELAASNDKVSELKTDSANLQAKASILKTDSATLRTELDAANDSISKEAQLANARDSVSDLKRQLTACQNGTAVASEIVSLLNIYHNPTHSGVLVIDDAELEAGKRVEVYAINGSLVGVYEIAGASTTVNIGNLAAGTYIVKVGKKAAKVVKQ